MAKPRDPVRVTLPPTWVLTAMNVVMRPLLASPLGRRFDDLILLEFTGRRTGRRFTVPVNVHLIDDVPTVITGRTWRLNFDGGAPVTVTHRGTARRARGTLVPATREEIGVAMRKALDNGDAPRSFGLSIARGYEPSAAELAALAEPTDSLITLEFDTGASVGPSAE